MGDHQFAKNTHCRKCGTPCPNPQEGIAPGMPSRRSLKKNPGDWFCSKCGDLQSVQDMKCKACGMMHPGSLAQMASISPAMKSMITSASMKGQEQQNYSLTRPDEE